LAEKANGLVFPATFICFAGATRTFRGTVSFPMDDQVRVLKRIASTLHAAGFKRTVLVAGRNPDDVGGIIAARALFDETEIPYFYLQGSRILELPEIKAMHAGYPGNFGETVIEMACLRILGRERPIPLANWTREPKSANNRDQPDEIFDDMKEMKRVGAVGWRYFEEKQHGGSGTAGMQFKGSLMLTWRSRFFISAPNWHCPPSRASNTIRNGWRRIRLSTSGRRTVWERNEMKIRFLDTML